MKDFGNTIIRPNSKVCGHFRMKDFTFVDMIEYDTPTRAELGSCTTMDALQALQPPDVTLVGPTMGLKVTSQSPLISKHWSVMGHLGPLKLIFAAQEAYTEFVEGLQDGDDIMGKIDAHMDILEYFLWQIHHGLIKDKFRT